MDPILTLLRAFDVHLAASAKALAELQRAQPYLAIAEGGAERDRNFLKVTERTIYRLVAAGKILGFNVSGT